jgi:hypothetical protein
VKTRNRLVALIFLSTLVWPGTVLQAQMPAAPVLKKIYTNKAAFKLPLQIAEPMRGQLREVLLYMKDGADGPWTLKESVSPSQKEFICRVAHDGEYSFAVGTLDKNGQRIPADLNQITPNVIVVVDRQAPDVDVHAVIGTVGESEVQCLVRDANPDSSKTKLEYLAADQSWQPMEPVAGRPGFFKASVPDALRNGVRATVTDLACNTTTKEINLCQPAAKQFADTKPLVFPASTAPQQFPDVKAMPNTLPDPQSALTAAESQSDKVATPPMPGTTPASPSLPHAEREGYAMAGGTATTCSALPGKEHCADASRSPGCPSMSGGGASTPQLINSLHASLKYQVDQEGPGGVAKVEVWMTTDDGQNWQLLCEDPDRRSPVEIDLPREGVYGLSLVVSSGAGSGGTPPQRGDAPDWRIEVDTTKPAAQLTSIRPGSGPEAGTFLITWMASDKNLKPDAIDLEFATQPNGPWNPIAKGLKNDGSYRWPGAGITTGEFYFRMTASDMAGNVTECTWPQPVVLGPSRLKAHVLGVVAGDGVLAPHSN